MFFHVPFRLLKKSCRKLKNKKLHKDGKAPSAHYASQNVEGAPDEVG